MENSHVHCAHTQQHKMKNTLAKSIKLAFWDMKIVNQLPAVAMDVAWKPPIHFLSIH